MRQSVVLPLTTFETCVRSYFELYFCGSLARVNVGPWAPFCKIVIFGVGQSSLDLEHVAIGEAVHQTIKLRGVDSRFLFRYTIENAKINIFNAV